MIREFVWWCLLLVAAAVFVAGIGIGISGNYGLGIVILLGDLAFMELINPDRGIW